MGMGLQCRIQDHAALSHLWREIWDNLLTISGPQLLRQIVQPDTIRVDWAQVQAKIVQGLVETGYNRYREWFEDCTGMSSGEEYTSSDSDEIIFQHHN
jgi:hypothetical protein